MDHLPQPGLFPYLPSFTPLFLAATLHLIQQRVVGSSIKHQPPSTTRVCLTANLCETRKRNSKREGREDFFFLEQSKQSRLEIDPTSSVLTTRDVTSVVFLCEEAAALGPQL